MHQHETSKTNLERQDADWRPYAGHFAWPTVIMAAIVLVAYSTVIATVVIELIPLWAALLLNSLFAYLAFTPLHEAAHGNIAGRTSHKRLERIIGWLCGFLLFAPFPAFRQLHLQHHGHTNDPEKDPDFWVAGNSWASSLIRCAMIIPRYYVDIIREILGSLPRLVREQRSIVLTLVAFVGILGWAALDHKLEILACVWLGPAALASAVLAFAFDWLPHQPHHSRERYFDTRIILGPGLSTLMTSQNYHLIHHLYPRIPFYRYRRYFERTRPSLESRGIDIIDLAPRSGKTD